MSWYGFQNLYKEFSQVSHTPFIIVVGVLAQEAKMAD